MKIFISYSSNDKEAVDVFVKFLRSSCQGLDLSFSKEDNGITVGSDFRKDIMDEIRNADIFIPIVSKDYQKSKLCMTELKIAYSLIFNMIKDENYIYPLSVPPLDEKDALMDTPISDMKTIRIDNFENMVEFIENLKDKGVIASRKEDIEHYKELYSHKLPQALKRPLFTSNMSLKNAKKLVFFDNVGKGYYKKTDDIISYKEDGVNIDVDFNMNPYVGVHCDFVGIALVSDDWINIKDLYESNNDVEFGYVVTSDSLKKIRVEFKTGSDNRIVWEDITEIENGQFDVRVPFNFAKIHDGWQYVKEICFVIERDYLIDEKEEQGSFELSGIRFI